MKKVSLLLALLLVLTCCLLAACGGDDGETSSSADNSSTNTSAASSDETTSDASGESSVEDPSEDSSVADPSDDSSAADPDDDSSDPETSGTDEPSNPGDANLALGKSYTGGDPSTREGVSHYNAKLTDGKAHDAISYDGEWFAFYYNVDATGAGNINAPDRVGTVVIDLEQVCSVSKVQVNAFLGNASGIIAPSSVKVEVSADGSSYTQLGSEKKYDKPAENDTTVDWVVISGSAIEGRYVKVTVTMDAYAPFAFINEIEVY